MKISSFSVNRPIFTIMVILIILILGSIAYTRLPIDLMPDITYPTLSVSTTYEGAGPEEVEELISKPMEEALSSVPGVKSVTSTSSEGNSRLRISFNWGTDLEAAASDVRAKIDRIIRRLPEEAGRPMLRKFDLAQFPVIIMGASSNLDPMQVRKIIEEQIKYIETTIALQSLVASRLNVDMESEVLQSLIDRLKNIYV